MRYTAIFARPLWRRALSTFRPEALALRTRNPCDFARFRLFGWYVCDIKVGLLYPKVLY